MEIDFNWWDCKAAKRILGGYAAMQNVYHDNFAPSEYIGNCTALRRKLCPNSYEDFFEKMVTFAENNVELPIIKRGLTRDELVESGKRYKQMIEERNPYINNDLNVYINDLLCHIIVETYDGGLRENEIIDYLTKYRGISCENFEWDIDTKYGVDVKIEMDNGMKYGIQVKPISFFCPYKHRPSKAALLTDWVGMVNKRDMMRDNFGMDTIYAIYVQDKKTGDVEWVKRDNGKLTFRLEDLFTYDENNIRGTIHSKAIPQGRISLPS